MSFKQNSPVAYNPWYNRRYDKNNQTQRHSEQITAAISRKNRIRQRIAIGNIKSKTDKPCRLEHLCIDVTKILSHNNIIECLW